jgi:hypothetical protein
MIVDARRFDAIIRLFADRKLSRRSAIRRGGAGLAAAGLTAAGVRAAGAAGATPPAGGVKGETAPAFVFVQSFQSGTFTPKDGSAGTFTLTLDHGLGQTVYFSDRPERVFGAAPTAAFLKGLPFGPDNPPNAALVLEAGPDDTDVVVLELTAPKYDEATHTATYEAKILTDYEKLGVTFQEAPETAQTLHERFGAASLFIDDCPDIATCYGPPALFPIGPVPGGPYGRCWNWNDFHCDACSGQPDDYYNDLCNNAYPACNNQCQFYST